MILQSIEGFAAAIHLDKHATPSHHKQEIVERDRRDNSEHFTCYLTRQHRIIGLSVDEERPNEK